MRREQRRRSVYPCLSLPLSTGAMCCTALIWMLCNRSRYPTRNDYLFALGGAFIKVGLFIADCTEFYSDLKVVDAIDSWEEDHGLSTTDQAVGSAIPDKIYADYPLKEVVYTVLARTRTRVKRSISASSSTSWTLPSSTLLGSSP